jgi:hypothetical protein
MIRSTRTLSAVLIGLFMARAVAFAQTPRPGDPPTVHATVTGRALVFNGQRDVPAGLFGVHATKLSPEQAREWGIESVRLIHQNPTRVTSPKEPAGGIANAFVLDCFFDRYQPALPLTDPAGWRDRLTQLARTVGEQAKTTGATHVVEFWNEPYLNWAGKPGVNYDGRHFDLARVVDGGPVFSRGESKPIDGLVWSTRLVAVDGAGNASYLASAYLPKDAKDGDTFDFRGRPTKVAAKPWVKDTNQPSFWSGPFNRGLYLQMLGVFGPELKRANPDVKLVAGWGFHLFQDDWRAWELIHRPTIDASAAFIDGYDEHHYGGDTRRVAASYEVAWAYALTKHGKRLGFYNTEAGGALDPERPDTPARTNSDQIQDPESRAVGAMQYTLRDIVYLIAKCPDKAVTRYAHEPEHNGGDERAFKLLRPLRGTLMETTSDDGDVWVVASRRDTGELAVVAFNDRAEAVQVRLTTPAGVLEAKVAAKSAHRWDARLDTVAGASTVTQTPAGKVLQRVENTPATFEVALDAAAVARANRAVLRVIAWNGVPGGLARLNGVDVPVRGQMIVDMPVDPKLLRDANVIEFPPAEKPYRVDAVSVLLIEETPR